MRFGCIYSWTDINYVCGFCHPRKCYGRSRFGFRFMALNATFNNISVILWRIYCIYTSHIAIKKTNMENHTNTCTNNCDNNPLKGERHEPKKTTAKLSENNWNKRRSYRFQCCHMWPSALMTVAFCRSTWIRCQKCFIRTMT
jgi:hypothetical protein